MDVERLQAILSVEDVTEENALDQIATALEASKGATTEQEEKVLALQNEVAALKASAGEDEERSTIGPDTLDVLAEGAEAKLSALVEKGKITPAVRDKLLAALVGPAEQRNVYALSRHVSKTPQSLVLAVADALAENDRIQLGERTGRQVVELRRVTPGESSASPSKEESQARGHTALSAAGMPTSN